MTNNSKNNVDFANYYLQQVTATEIQDYNPAKERLSRIYLCLIKDSIKKIVPQINNLDLLKKEIFYNKKTDLTNNINNLNEIIDKTQLPENILKNFNEKDVRILHHLLGIITESAELLQALLNRIDTQEFDIVNLKEEAGDIGWYLWGFVDAIQSNIAEVMDMNGKKLKARYPSKFSNESANNRDLAKERSILEDK
jgi:NTP pyrophosphatase (non-canonical NTP hydrolase)